MDISKIRAEFVTPHDGIAIGPPSERTLIEFLNLRCPYCRKWFEDSYEILQVALQNHKVQRVIKLLDMEKTSLQRGNVMHRYVNFSDPKKALAEIAKIFETQGEWGELSLPEVAAFAENKLGLTEDHHEKITAAIRKEAELANVTLVPSLFLEDAIFDEAIELTELEHRLGLS